LYAIVRKTSNAVFLKNLGVNLSYADISCPDSLEQLVFPKIAAFFHCAARMKFTNWQQLYKTNVVGTQNICKLALKLGVDRFIYLSSVAVVSGNKEIPIKPDFRYNPTNIYGLSKVEAEKKVLEFRNKGLRVAILRPCSVYGEFDPRLDPIFFLLRHRLFPLVNGGNAKWHMVYVRNVVNALLLGLRQDELLRGAYFVADDDILTLREIFTILSRTIKIRPPLILPVGLTPLVKNIPYLGKKLEVFINDRILDMAGIKSLGYKAEFKTEESLIKTAQSWLDSRR
jgi:nucleoside-diphosphate-sugar epimerase